MIKTIGGEKSLIQWTYTKNGISLTENVGETILNNTCKKVYLHFFTYCLKHFTHKKHISFSKEWVELCNKACRILARKLKINYNLSEKDVERVVHKFRGNVGEILAEYYFKEIDAHFDASTYTPVDPTDERYVDATIAAKDGVSVNIQIKNYKGEVDALPFLKLMAEEAAYIRGCGKDITAISKYLERKRQYLFSFTDRRFSPNLDMYNSVVAFIGSTDIDILLKNQEIVLDMFDCIRKNILTVLYKV